MPALDKIIISPTDMQSIMESVAQTGYTGDVIIIDTIHSYTIRDINDFFLTEVKKTNSLHLNQQHGNNHKF